MQSLLMQKSLRKPFFQLFGEMKGKFSLLLDGIVDIFRKFVKMSIMFLTRKLYWLLQSLWNYPWMKPRIYWQVPVSHYPEVRKQILSWHISYRIRFMTCLKLMMCWMRMDNQYFNNRSKNSLTSIGTPLKKW